MKGKQVQRIWVLILSVILALTSVSILLFRAHYVASADATTHVLYVDGSTGNDSGDCRVAALPCKSINFALSHTTAGDTVLVAQGVYIENLIIVHKVTLEGGYEATNWTRDVSVYQTIVDGADGSYVLGNWDGRQVVHASILNDDGQYKMWYDGWDILGNSAQVGLATSDDGITWTKYVTNPVLNGDAGAWDEWGEHASFVLKEDGVYKMWYEGDSDKRQLGYATSSNGIDWDKYSGNPVLEAGPEGYDQETAGHGSVLKENDIYKLWYHAIGDEGGIIAYATSPDGIDWSKQGPVLKPDNNGWDNGDLWGPSVLKLNDTYWMWYASSSAIGVVTSTNGISWNRFLIDPALGDDDAYGIGAPHVISDAGKLKMWYSVWFGDPWRGRIDYAESVDGINWTKYSGNPVLSPGELGEEGHSVISFYSGSEGSLLDGFVVRNGHAPNGGGIVLWSTTVTIHNNTISANTAHYSGGGIFASEQSQLTATQNKIVNNHATNNHGGGIATDRSSQTILVDNTIDSNSALRSSGGGIGVNQSQGLLTIAENEVSNNEADWGGGIDVSRASAPVSIAKNHVHDNEAAGNGGVRVWASENAEITVDSNDIRNNGATEPWAAGGAGFHDVYGEVTFVNNIIAGNENEGLEAANFNEFLFMNNTIVGNGRIGVELFAWPSTPAEPFTGTLTNNIIAGHNECGIGGFHGVTIMANYNDLWANGENFCAPFTGSNNMSLNPLFVDAVAGDYQLGANSPAIDTGTGTGAPSNDIIGIPRPIGDGFDIGAYEWAPHFNYLPIVVGD